MATNLLVPSPSRWRAPGPDEAFVADPTAARGIDVRFIVAAVRRRAVWIAAIIALALAAGLLITMLQAPRYTAQASVQINSQSDRVLGQGEDLQEQSNAFDDRFLKTQVDVLKSRGLAVRVAQKLKLFGSEAFYAGMGVDPPAGAPEAVVREIAVGLLRGNLSVDLPYDSRIATITFTSGEPALSAQIANAFAGEFIQANLQRRYDSSAYARQFLADQLGETKDRLEDSERGLNAYARNAGLIRAPAGASGDADENGGGVAGIGSVTTASLFQLNSAANEARQARIAAEVRWRAINAAPLLSSKEVLANGTVQTLMTERATLATRLQELRAEHLDDYPGIREANARLAEVERQLQQTARSVRNAARSDLAAAAASERALAAQVNALKGATLSEQDRSVNYNLLAREADTNRSLYDALLQRYKELNAAAGVSASNIAIIDEAEPPLGPSSPNLARNMLLALVLGLAVAALLVLATIHFDDAIRVPEDIEAKLGLPLLGVVPRSETDPDEALIDPKSPLSEGYNALRAALLHSTAEGLPPILLVTSAQPEEGKTTTSHAIALSLARLGKSVLLVDGDMRRPAVHRLFGISNERGLSSLLTTLDPLESAVSATAEPHLSVLPSGPVPPSPTELTSSNRFRALIDEMAEKFDVAVIDSPPILGLADAPAMSALVDGVVVVVESERSRRGGLHSALRRLRSMRPNLLGAVLTKFDTSRAANRYSDYYGANYYEYRNESAAA
ncbi:MAG: polysaccharide biosynthesis tyrosine autokinase [Novosphingobium sp.]|nr:polysaccharide biosynthesis tyrosine autokinase [Novosphingobium sp.]